MDSSLTSDKAVSEEQHDPDESGGKCQTANEGEIKLNETASVTEFAGTGDAEEEEEEEEEEELAGKVKPDHSSPDGNDLCSICGFQAKCPRALKIHVTRKHGKNSRKRTKSDQDGEAASQMATATVSAPEEENSEEADQNQELDPNSADEEVKSVAKDHGIYARGSVKTETVVAIEPAAEDAECPTQERRLSKRTPKPKVIHSCNYCGQEFWDKSLLEVHVKRTHAKDTPYTFDAEENMEEEEEDEAEEAEEPLTETEASTLADLPVRVAPKRMLSRFQLKCSKCEFRVSTPALLESHARVKHPSTEWYRCKLCHYSAASAEWMETHLSSDGHKQRQEGDASDASATFKDCVEKVCRDVTGDGTLVNEVAQGSDGGEGPSLCEGHRQAEEAVEAARVELAEGEEVDEQQPAKKKRGRPKQTSTTTCGHCGLVVSNATNLSVHVRRKHSKEYGYNCTLCNYSCVTKGDMDRHCVTKKHVRRVQESAGKKQEQDPIEVSDQRAEESSQDSDGEPGPDSGCSEENGKEDHEHVDSSEKKSKYDSVNACSHCDFVAHSIPSLHSHVKRKHTKDYEFVCLACSYYAVTSREMSRHSSTEKHKQKSQRYQETQNSVDQSTLPLPLEEVTVLDGEADADTAADPASPATATAETTTEMPDENSMKTEGASEMPCDEDQNPNRELAHIDDPSDEYCSQEECENMETDDALDNDAEMADDKEDNSVTDTQMSKALPFDACIVSIKALTEQEKALSEGMSREGEAAVVRLTLPASALPTFPAAPASAPVSPHVKRIRPRLRMKCEGHTHSRGARIRCDDCGFMADGLSGLNVHISMKHPTKEKHSHCMVCGKSFYTESNLHQHLTSASHLRNEQNSVEELPEGGATFKCVKCTERFETEQGLFLHINEKHEALLREVNKYVLEDTEQINREREENQGSVCKFCGKVCKSSNSMAFLAHVRTHTGSKPFKCKICNFATAQLGDARNHVKRHLGMREYKCDICGGAKGHLMILLSPPSSLQERTWIQHNSNPTPTNTPTNTNTTTTANLAPLLAPSFSPKMQLKAGSVCGC
ncbi:Zinc finger protein 407 [Merluccius polli]|uniref:Zinc finger protein 407 n=1 Tax=Merluccius polli TaxID=89951 RepID=A0AA47MSX3_MERPO|nr:Zinc finger protein 407 [Merluccius polli]